jgi:uncharacterized protein (TIGR02246 family)
MATQTRSTPKRRAQRKTGAGSAMSSPLAKIRALVERQARSWEQNDFDRGAVDWLPEGVLVSPGGQWSAEQVRGEMANFHAAYTDLAVTIKNVFAAADGRKVAIEWDWEVTRKSDGKRGNTHDAIIVDLRRGKIKSWREYFDLGSSVEAPGSNP